MRSVCGSCSKTFESIGTFDAHRIGGFNGRPSHARRCMTTEEMLAGGRFAVETIEIWAGSPGDRYLRLKKCDVWYDAVARRKLLRTYQRELLTSCDVPYGAF